MTGSKRHYLFSEAHLSSTLEAHIHQAQGKVDQIPRDQFLISPDEDIFDFVFADLEIIPITLREEERVISDEEMKLDVPSMFGDEKIKVPGVRITISIPYSGDSELWKLQPTRFSLSPPHGLIRKSATNNGGILDIVIEQRVDASQDQIIQELNRDLEQIRTYLADQKFNIDEKNSNLKDLIRQAIKSRRDRLEKHDGLIKMLDIPLQRKAGALDFKPIVLEKKVIHLPSVPQGGFIPEPGITDAGYESILSIIRHEGRTFETTPATYKGLDEPDLRNILLAHLNGHYQGGATGETFRGQGKTDIRIEFENRAAFVAECKIWRGEKVFVDAIDQMLGYLTWRDCKCALVVFNKENARFSEILEKIPGIARQHQCFHREINQQQSGEWRLILTSQEDPARQITVQFLVFNLYVRG